MPDCGQCKKYRRTITHHIAESVGKFSDPGWCVAGVVAEGGILQELSYLKVACLGHIRQHGVLLWNEPKVDWLSVAICLVHTFVLAQESGHVV